jgi:hypothetical protein
MISIAEFQNIHSDSSKMVVRKGASIPHHMSGVVINKKSETAYTINIESDTEDLEANSMIKVACTCDDFKFRWAAVLYQKDALIKPTRFRLDPPKKTNPNMIVGGCKHINEYIIHVMSQKIKGFSKVKNKI